MQRNKLVQSPFLRASQCTNMGITHTRDQTHSRCGSGAAVHARLYRSMSSTASFGHDTFTGNDFCRDRNMDLAQTVTYHQGIVITRTAESLNSKLISPLRVSSGIALTRVDCLRISFSTSCNHDWPSASLHHPALLFSIQYGREGPVVPGDDS